MVAALLSSAGSAAAGTYQGVATHNGTAWSVTWSNVFPACFDSSPFLYGSAIIATVDGAEVNMNIAYLYQDGTLGKTEVRFDPSPAGVMTKLTFQGQDSFQCDGHTFLLPGYVAPPAPVPTLSEWAMILLGVALAGGAALTIQRRRQAA